MAKKLSSDPRCPCDSGKSYAECCAPCLSGVAPAPTAEALMRSRYCAYVCGDAAYLLRTWHSTTRPARLDFPPEGPLRRLGLKILQRTAGKPGDSAGKVEFVARFKSAGKAGRMREISRFVYEEGRWLYVDGEMAP